MLPVEIPDPWPLTPDHSASRIENQEVLRLEEIHEGLRHRRRPPGHTGGEAELVRDNPVERRVATGRQHRGVSGLVPGKRAATLGTPGEMRGAPGSLEQDEGPREILHPAESQSR